MRRIVKKWGNGLAVRLPKQDPEYGVLDEGAEVEIRVRRVTRPKDEWKPYIMKGPGYEDMSTNHDAYAWGYLDEKFPAGRTA